jgi:hypothetical protein
MHRELKEIAGILMRVLRGGEVSLAELADMIFVAESELHLALAEACVSLLEFACHRDMRSRDAAADRAMRAKLEMCLERIVETGERVAPAPRPAATIH